MLVELLVVAFSIVGIFAFYRGLKSPDKGIVPPRKMNLRNFFEYTAESVYGMVEGAMGEHNAARFFPLIGALWMFILFGNLIGLIPGFISPNDTLKTNVGIALLVFVLTHYLGVKEHGLAYFKHFLGPSLVLAPLMLPIEIISHIARPVSLSVRLMGIMMADHKVVMSFFALVPILVPLPFLLLGLLICLIQALVFTLVWRWSTSAWRSSTRSIDSIGFVANPLNVKRSRDRPQKGDTPCVTLKPAISLLVFLRRHRHLGHRLRLPRAPPRNRTRRTSRRRTSRRSASPATTV